MPEILVFLFADLTPTSAVCLSVGFAAAASIPFWLSVDADVADLDPRPLAHRTLTAAHQGAVHAGHDVNRARATSQRLTGHALREAALTVAALLALLFPAAGGTR